VNVVDQAVPLSPGQTMALETCVLAAKDGGRFVFLTGAAGTGKSTVLAELRKRLRCVVLAPTGLAAINVGGMTIHRFFKLPIGCMTSGKAGAARDRRELLQHTDAVVIDEISMVRADLLDAVNWSLQKTLGNSLPFGGLTMIVVGDMWQLEPVVTERERPFIDERYTSPFWFDAGIFTGGKNLFGKDSAQVEIETVELQEVFRQRDPAFLDALNAVRIGSADGLAYFNQHGAKFAPVDCPSIVYTNKKAAAINDGRLRVLPADARDFDAVIEGDWKPSEYPAPDVLALAVGARVMATKNTIIDAGNFVANGTLGHIRAFLRGLPVVEFDDGRVSVMQRAEWDQIGTEYDPKEDKLVETVVGKFAQVPLKLAWAITAHKSQGQTLAQASLEMETQSRTHGQLYVALSRVRSVEGLYLRRRLTASDLVVSPRVREFCGLGADTAAFAA